MMIEGTTNSSILPGLSGNSIKINQIKKIIKQVAKTDVNVLITGESGTGKEIAGRLIHAESNRHQNPFVAVNCGAIPADLLESELFGHEKGAFTGAVTSRVGRFELAHTGTIFLDEIGDMPHSMQVKILRVIQEKGFERVGSNKTIKVDVRIIAATHRNLDQEMIKGRFREDLYYRLNVFPIEMPSLRDRVEDIPTLTSEIISRFEQDLGVGLTLSNEVIDTLKKSQWNGNIRELSNLIERLMVLFPNQTVTIEQLPDKYKDESTNVSPAPIELSAMLNFYENVNLKDMLQSIELKFIKEALKNTQGIVSHAAEKLGMRRTTLIEKMKKFNIEKADWNDV